MPCATAAKSATTYMGTSTAEAAAAHVSPSAAKTATMETAAASAAAPGMKTAATAATAMETAGPCRNRLERGDRQQRGERGGYCSCSEC